MPKSIHDPAARAALLARLDRLDATTPARWGSFTAPRMVTHLIESARMATGDLPVKARRTFLSNRLVRYLFIYVAPFPRGAPTAPELLARAPNSWAADVATLKAEIERAAVRGPAAAWPAHPAFGALSGADWGVLIHKHTDHHLSQFGV
ncbi:MAG: DUF1569 domain-containing protein [Gemmatimonadetes bacterium]|nr:DUF1569 domain-containing protein [Gemmatimonadota bacterium]